MANEGIVHIVNLSKYCWQKQNQQFFRKLTICFDFFVPQYLHAVILEKNPQHIVILWLHVYVGMFYVSGQLARKIGLKVLEMGGGAVIG